jgi:hypothetical protein
MELALRFGFFSGAGVYRGLCVWHGDFGVELNFVKQSTSKYTDSSRVNRWALRDVKKRDMKLWSTMAPNQQTIPLGRPKQNIPKQSIANKQASRGDKT